MDANATKDKGRPHYWYSVFRNIGVWAIASFVCGWLFLKFWYCPPSDAGVLELLVGLLVALPVFVLCGFVFPYRTDGILTTRRAAFGWLAGGFLGAVAVFGVISNLVYTINNPYISITELYEIAQESLACVEDEGALEADALRALKSDAIQTRDFLNDHTTYPELANFVRHLQRRGIRTNVEKSDFHGPVLVVRVRNCNHFVLLGFHERWEDPPELLPYQTMAPYLIFSHWETFDEVSR